MLLALILCLQLLPTAVFAAAEYSIEVPESVEGGRAEISTTVVGLTTAKNKVSGITANTQLVTIKAIADAGYKFTGWDAYQDSKSNGNFTKIPNDSMAKILITYGKNANGVAYTLSDPELSLSIGKMMKKNLRFVPVFAKALSLTAGSSDSAKGSLSGATEFFPGGEAVTLTAVPEEGCTFTGCTLAYTESNETVPATDYTLKIEENTVTLTLGAKVTSAVTVTGHFVNATEPNFIVPGKELKVNSKGYATVTGWNNNSADKIIITLSTVDTASGIMFYLKEYNQTDKTYSQCVPTNVTFDFSKTTSISKTYNETANGKLTFALKGEGLSTLLEIPFTVTDGTDRGHTKEGVIRLELANRALVSSGKGTVKYNGKEYKDGEWIDFTAGADGKATVEAVGYEDVSRFGISTLMQFSAWAIKNVELSDDDSKTNPLTFTLPNKFFEITPSFDTKAKTLSIQAAEGGSASFADGKTSVVQVWNGTKLATATAAPSAGYAFSSWKLSVESLKNQGGGTATIEWKDLEIGRVGAYRVGEGNTKYSNPLQIALTSQNLRLTPVFVDKVALTATSSDAERGSATASATELPVGGDGVTLTVTAAEGCTFENWTVTYTETGSQVPSGAYTLTQNQDGTWKLVNNSVGQAMTVTASFYSDKDANFVAEGKLPAFVSLEGESSSAATVSGWTNDTTEKIVVTFNRIYSNSKIYLKKDGVELVPANVTIDIQNPSGTTITKTTTDTDVYYDLGNISDRTEIPFTAADGRGNTKTGVIRLEVANHAQVSITSGKESGTITYSGKTYSDGDMLIFTPTDGKVTVKAVPAKGYRFVGWVIDGVKLTDGSAAEITFDAPTQFITLKATFEKFELKFKLMVDGEDKTGTSLGYGGVPYDIYTFTDDMDIDTAIQNWRSFTRVGAVPAKISAGTHILLRVHAYPDAGTYAYTGMTVSPQQSMQERVEYPSANYSDTQRYYLFDMPESDLNITVNVKTAAYVKIQASAEQENTGSVEFTPASETGMYREGTPILMTAIPAEGYAFKEWKESSSTYLSAAQKTSATVQFTAGDIGATFTAVFEQTGDSKQLPIVLKTEPDAKATILINGSESTTTAAYGSKIAVSLCNLDEYYLFDHWEITQNTTGESNLIREVDKGNASISFVMPNDSKGVTIKAVLKERTIPVSFRWTVDGSYSSRWSEYMTFTTTVNEKAVSGSTTVKKGDVLDVTVKIAKEYETQYVLNTLKFALTTEDGYALATHTDTHAVYTVTDWLRGIEVWADLTKKTEATTRYAITLTQPTTGGTIQSSNQTAMAGTEVTLTAVPAAGYALKAWTVTSGGNAVTVTAKQDDANQATFTMPAADVAVTAEFTKVEIVAPKITAVQLLDSTTKDVIASGVLTSATDTWVITLPANVEQSVLGNLTMQYLKITHTGVSAAMKGGTDDATFTYKWANGDIMCGMQLDTEATFTITAADKTTKKEYKIKIVKAEPTEEGAYTIKYSGPKGGTIIPSKAKANAGETITLTIKPDSGKQMKAGTLTYTIAVTNGETVSITGTSFVMPENNVTLSCMWEDAKTSGDDTTVSGITAFSIDGVAGVVDNTDNTISVIMPYKTDVTKLIPTIAGNNIRSISPASGKMVNFSRPVTYTVTLTDGTVKQYTVTVYVQAGSKADQMWDKLTDFYDQTPWWDYADHQTSTGSYPKYW